MVSWLPKESVPFSLLPSPLTPMSSSRAAHVECRAFPRCLRQMAHGFQEDLLQRAPAVRELPPQQILPRREPPDRFDLDPGRQDDPPAPTAFGDPLGADLRPGHPQVP